MTQVSHYKLNKELERELFHTFWSSISQLRTAFAVSGFFSDLLTKTEEIMLAKRFAVALMLYQGKKPIEIAGGIHVSYSTIRGISSWLDRATPQTLKLLDSVVAKQSWQTLLDSLEKMLDRLPPRYGTNWSKAGKAKWQRHKERSARQALR